MRKLAVQLMSIGLVLGFGVAPAMAQLGSRETGRANTAEDFDNLESSDGFLGSGTNIWDLYHQSGAIRNAENGYSRSRASRQLGRQAESWRSQQRTLGERQATEDANFEFLFVPTVEPAE